MKNAAESFHPIALSQLIVDRIRTRTHGAQLRGSTAVAPRRGLSKRPTIQQSVRGRLCRLTLKQVLKSANFGEHLGRRIKSQQMISVG
jgi:hypothetical protein